VVAESTTSCPSTGIGFLPRLGSDAGVGVDAGAVVTGRFVVQSIEYAGGPTFGPLVAEFEIEETHGEPRVISADELLWVGTSEGYLVGYDVATGEPEAEVDLGALFAVGAGVTREVNSLQTYRSSGDLYALVAFGPTLGRLRIRASGVVAMGQYDMIRASDARIHPVVPLRDEGYVVALDTSHRQLVIIPRIDVPGAAAALDDLSNGRVVIPEAAGSGFVWAGRSSTTEGDVRTVRSGDLAEVARFDFTSGRGGARIDGLSGPEEPSTVPADLVVALTLDNRGQLFTLARESLAVLETGPGLDGPISAFVARAAESELYAVYAVGASGLGGSELVAVVPTATGLSPRAVRAIEMADEVLDLALGLEEFREPPEPDVPLPSNVVLVHVLIEHP